VTGSKNLNQVLKQIADYIQSIAEIDLTPSRERLLDAEIVIGIDREHAVILADQPAHQFRQCIEALAEVPSPGDQMSRKAIEGALQTAVVVSLYQPSAETAETFEQRLQKAIQGLRATLTAAGKTYHVFWRVIGLAADALPIKVGNATFCVFDELQAKKLAGTLGTEPEWDAEGYRSFLNSIFADKIDGKTVGLVEVIAIDFEAAKQLAFRELRRTVDVINYTANARQTRTYITLQGDAEATTETVPVLQSGDSPSFQIHRSRIGPDQPLNLRWFLGGTEQDLGLKMASDILADKDRRELARLVLTAIEWTGRAGIDRRKEEAFLLYAIALECLVLGQQNEGELTYRLQTRIAHLVGGTVEKRKEIAKLVGELYRIRSKIVHNGQYEVTDADLELIRYFAVRSINRVLMYSPFVDMQTFKDLRDWFEDQVLR
jgi:hypothetical protein